MNSITTPTPSSNLSALEAWGLARCSDLQQLESITQRLSNVFTDERPETYTTYLEDPDVLTAYALFFAPQTVARVSEALDGILARLPPFPNRPLRVLDLGCGIGSALIALRNRFGTSLELTGVDWSTAALDAAKTLVPGLKTIQANLREFVPEESYDIIVSSFAFNEAFPNPTEAAQKLNALGNALRTDAPSFVLILEPASRIGTPQLLALRSQLTSFPLYAPCPHANVCPLKTQRDGICHDVRKFHPTRSMTLLNRHLFRSISEVKYTVLAFGHHEGPSAEGFGKSDFLRMIGPMDKGKGVLTCRACMGDGAIRKIELPSAVLTAARRHTLLTRQRGDCAWLDGPLGVRKQLEQGTCQRTADLRFTDEAAPLIDHNLDDFTFSI
ncbi:MAG: small ribosomal subunit Rsm22 family protein [Kiritimatiellia bacterium]